MRNILNRTVLSSVVASALLLTAATVSAQAAPVRNIVLVHGAFVGGAGWRPVYDILTKDGYHVTLVQEPLTSFPEDVAAAKRILALQDGPTVLVGHSYGGAIITEAGNDPHVAGLVYIAAHALDNGETEAGNGKKLPNTAHPFARTPDGFLYINPANYPADFAADLPRRQAGFEARAQMLTSASVFTANIADPAWKTKPSWYMVAKADKIISPDLERMYAARAHSHTVEIEGASHSVYESHPKQVAALIEQAARHALD
ncbi:alpha/beta fold hydrolase [Acerihabitans arboris]|uniref:Alpha/beta fold hydrolase n=1 Tax=Acerihabitans arboris TaxID=2691583 RepID=A0A845SK59_9GAMM|nr:alpha/beta hydrolase [Acerihabitans arboris]NDL63772.1 alpha/beta fold hydrolase [Acerihabitans arboris]